MDLFGRKRIVELERANDNLSQRLMQCDIEGAKAMKEARELRNQVEYLVRTIRDMDQEIWNMGQKDNWPAQRPHFAKLHDEMTARKVAESKRIGDILRPQLIETYTETDKHMTKRLR